MLITDTWASAGWLAETTAWLDDRLAEAGRRRTGEVTQPRIRPWGTVLTAPTDAGPVWLKVPGPATAFEVGLYDLLTEVAPDAVLHPLAVDTGGGRLLLPDGGSSLGETLTGAELLDALTAALPGYGRLQRDVAPQADRLLALGLGDMRPAVMPQRFDEAIEVAARYADRLGSDDDRALVRRAAACREPFISWCAQLAESPVAASIDHNDLHPWNILTGDGDSGGNGGGSAVVYDWGDSVVSHPFASLLVTLSVVADLFGVAVDDPVIHRVRDAYLESFGDLAPHAQLVAELELACAVGKAARALTWERALRAGGDDEASEFTDAPFVWITGVLGPSWLELRP